MQLWLAKAWGWLLGLALTATVFFFAGVMFEHRPKQSGLIARVTGQGLAAQRDDWRDVALGNKHAAETWKAKWEGCDAQARRANANATASVTDTSARADVRGTNAFNSGYSAGRVAGLKACGAPHAQDPLPAAPGAPGGPGDGVVRDDLAQAFGAGAYQPR